LENNLLIQLILSTICGSLLGTIVGMLPGIGPVACIAIVLPYITDQPALISLSFVAAIYYGAQYGGSTTSILFNIPGDSSSAITCIDGHKLSQSGRAWPALKVAALGSFIAGIFGIVITYFLAPYLSVLSTFFTPNELFILSVFGVLFATSVFSENKFQNLYGTLLGIMISLIGFNALNGLNRFTHGVDMLSNGIDMVIIAGGMLGGSEILMQLWAPNQASAPISFNDKAAFLPGEKAKCAYAIGRGTIIGSFLGLIPGGGAILASYVSYAVEKLFTKKVGTGVLEGVAAPESANNAGAQTAFIPLLALGIPENAVMSLIFGLMIQQGMIFGPVLFSMHFESVTLLLTSMLIGNIMLVCINLPMLKFTTKIYMLPQKLILTMAGLVLLSGIYSLNFSIIDLGLLIGFALLGILLTQANISPMTVIIGFTLGTQIEDRFVKSLIISDGDYTKFIFNHALLFVIVVSSIYYLISKLTNPTPGHVSQE